MIQETVGDRGAWRAITLPRLSAGVRRPLRFRRSKSVAGLWSDRHCDASEYPVRLTGETCRIE